MRLAAKLALGLALVAGALTAVTQWRAGAREAAVQASHPPEGQFIEVAGLKVHAVVMGEGPDVVLIHGASSSHRDFTFDLAPRLANRYRVIVVDRPGFGYSDPLSGPDGGSLIAQAEIIQAVAQSLGAERPLVAGHSYGGAVALAWATSAPDSLSGLVTFGAPAYTWPGDTPALQRNTATFLGRTLLVPLITAFVPESRLQSGVMQAFLPQDPPDGYADHFGPMMSARRTTLRINAMQRSTLKPQVEAMAPLYPNLDLPLVIVHGTEDSIVSTTLHAIPLQQAVPGAQLTLKDGIGHAPHHADPAGAVQAIDLAASRAGLR